MGDRLSLWRVGGCMALVLACVLTVVTGSLAQTRVLLAKGLTEPRGLAIDMAGNILCADKGIENQGVIKRILPSGAVDTFMASPKHPERDKQFVFESIGALGRLGDKIATLDYSSGTVYMVAGGDGSVLAVPFFSERIYVKDASGSFRPSRAYSMTLDESAGHIYVAGPDREQRAFGPGPVQLVVRRWQVASEGSPQRDVVYRSKDFEFKSADVSAVAMVGGDLFVAMAEGLLKVDKSARVTRLDKLIDKGFTVSALLSDSGVLYMAGVIGKIGVVYRVNVASNAKQEIARDLGTPSGLAVARGNLYIADSSGGRIWRIALPRAGRG